MSSSTKIIPTIGRIVWFYPGGKAAVDAKTQPFAAMVAFVHGGGQKINIGYLNEQGHQHNLEQVQLIQEGEPIPAYEFCCWMPYQQAQAAGAAAKAAPAAPAAAPASAAKVGK